MPDRPPPSDPFALCGTTIDDKYRVVSVVGTGGFGVVYRGVHTGFGEPIAVKCLKLPGELDTAQRERFLTRLQDEGRVLHRLSRLSSGIVQALDVGAITTPNGQWVPYLVLEWLEGQTLADWLKQRRRQGEGGMPLAEAVALLDSAASALSIAHEQKVAHRDVKPENLVLTDAGGHKALKILDFGIAKVLTAHTEFTAAPAATQKSPTAFTPSYGAPEQFNKKRGATGPWTDVFALALIVVELASGERALDGDDATQLYIAAADPAARPTLRYRGVRSSDLVESVLLRALAVDPHDRYPDAGSFWAALREAIADAPTDTPPPDVSETGDFVSRNAIDLEPGVLSHVDRHRPADDEAPTSDATTRAREPAEATPRVQGEADTAAARVDEGDRGTGAGSTKPSDSVRPGRVAPPSGGSPARSPADAPRSASRRAAGGERSATEPRPPSGAARSGSGRGSRAEPPRASATRERNDTTRFGDTVDPESTSGSRVAWWMPLVAIAALAGAGLLYIQLERETSNGPTTATGSTAAPTRTRPGHTARPQPMGDAAVPLNAEDGGLDGGDVADATVDGDVDGGDGGAFGPPPEGMVFIAPQEAGVPQSIRGFFLDRTEVTTADYRACVMAGRCVSARRVVLSPEMANRIWGTPDAGPDEPTETPEELARAWGKRCNDVRGALDHPINCVNHASAEDYCRFAGKRLPTNAEWSLAAGRAGRRYPWGDDAPSCGFACYGLNGRCINASTEVATCVVGAHERDRSPDGVLDLGGNVSEWVADQLPASAPHLPSMRRVRGGSFTDEMASLGSTASQTVSPVTAYVTIGFRCALDAPDGYEPPAP